MRKIQYYSSSTLSPAVGFGEALLRGLAPDGGLYMPSSIPTISSDKLKLFSKMSYPEIAAEVLGTFLEGDIDREEIVSICESVYSFEIPVEKLDNGLHILRLDGGPTASFKDFAARFMARVFSYFLEKEDREITILTATSGDTGSAVASAFYGMERIKVLILYPGDEVSELQRKQMTTMGGNISILAVKGKFDDCQSLVKKAFSDDKLKGLNLSSANSINIGRLLPQIVYYFYAWSRVSADRGKVVFSVPSGNFGNLSGGLLAARMGLPVARFIAAVNENDEFPLFLNSGSYHKVEPSRNCLSSAMNVGHPSNLARIIDLYGGNMDHRGVLIRMPDIESLKNEIVSYAISDDQTKDILLDIYQKYGVVMEPHGAVALGGYNAYRSEYRVNTPVVIFETAHPAKFGDIVEQSTGLLPEAPESFAGLKDRTEIYKEIGPDYESFRKYLLRST